MNENNKTKRNSNNKQKHNLKNKPKPKTKLNYNYKHKRKDETKKLLKKRYHPKKPINFNLLKDIFISQIKSLITNQKENLKEFNYIYKSFLVLFFIFTFIFLSAFYTINIGDYQLFKGNNVDIINHIKKNKTPIKVAYYCDTIKYGGVQRVMALLLNNLSKEDFFINYLITNSERLKYEYPIPNNVIRISLSEQKINLYEALEQEHIDILIYNFYENKEIEKLNELNNTKVIFYDHSCFLIWVYQKIFKFQHSVYQAYKKCKYVISLIPLENDYLFKIWGINSVLMDNPSTFEYNNVVPSDLSQKNIIMIGRAEDYMKRYDLGIKAMKYILEEIPECIMNLVSETNKNHEKLIKILNLEKSVQFLGFSTNIEIYLQKASLHIMPSLCEAYPMVLSEAKIFGLPTIICGLDYLALAKGGTVIIYDDKPETIAKEAVKILKDDEYRKKLGKEARESMQEHKNEYIIKKWVELLWSVYKGDDESFRSLNTHKKMTEEEADVILNNQLNLFKKRMPFKRRVNLQMLKSFSIK